MKTASEASLVLPLWRFLEPPGAAGAAQDKDGRGIWIRWHLATSASPHAHLLSPRHTEHRAVTHKGHSKSLTEPGPDACKDKRERVSEGDMRPWPDSSCTDSTAESHHPRALRAGLDRPTPALGCGHGAPH